MKIMFVTPAMTYGGAERVISILCNEWDKKNHTVSIIITGENEQCVYPLSKRVGCICLGGINKSNKYPHLELITKIRQEISEEKPDIVIAFMNDTCAYTAIAMLGLKTPLIYSERNDPKKVNQSKKDKIYRKIAEYFSKGIVFQTYGAQKCYSKRVQKKSAIILNPMNIMGLPECDYKNMKKEIVTVGRLEPQKNHKLLIDAFAKIAEKFSEYNLKIYGTGSLENELKEQIQKLHLESRILLMGNSKHVLEDIKQASQFVFSSDFEGLPNSLIEAMALGLPCISTDCSPGGAREVIKDGENGLLTECGNVDELAKAMCYLLDNQDKANEFGRKAKDVKFRVESGYIANCWIEFIKQFAK